MRILQIVGAILIAAGLFVFIKSPSYTSEKSMIKIGGVEAKVSQEHQVPHGSGSGSGGRSDFARGGLPQGAVSYFASCLRSACSSRRRAALLAG